MNLIDELMEKKIGPRKVRHSGQGQRFCSKLLNNLLCSFRRDLKSERKASE